MKRLAIEVMRFEVPAESVGARYRSEELEAENSKFNEMRQRGYKLYNDVRAIGTVSRFVLEDFRERAGV